MTTEEFSNNFDLMVNTTLSNQFGKVVSPTSLVFDEYEKSLFLSNAQNDIVIDLYKGKNIIQEAFESTEEVRRYLNPLIRTEELTNFLSTSIDNIVGLSDKSKFIQLPEDVWFITYEGAYIDDEEAGCFNNTWVNSVIPVTQDEYNRINSNPFKQSSKRRVLRLEAALSTIELISKFNIAKYKIRYLSKPKPIILTDLTDGLEIDLLNTIHECELPTSLHNIILDRAVNYALMSKNITINK